MHVYPDLNVIELASDQQASLAAQILGDFGAEVIKLEDRARGNALRNERPREFLACNRNKKSIAVDAFDADRDRIHNLLADADVVVTDWPGSELEEKGLDYESVRQTNPEIIYAYGSAFGSDKPVPTGPAGEAAVQAACGIAVSNRFQGCPPLLGNAAICGNFGGYQLAHGVMLALLARERHGIGQEVDVSMFSAGLMAQNLNAAGLMNRDEKRPSHDRRRGCVYRPGNPFYAVYQTKDPEGWLAICNRLRDNLLSDACRALELPDSVAEDARFAKLGALTDADSDALYQILQDAILRFSREEAVDRLRAGNLVAQPVLSFQEAFQDPRATKENMAVTFPSTGTDGDPLTLIASPIWLSDTPAQIRGAPPKLGEHTTVSTPRNRNTERPQVRPESQPGSVLDGIRVLDFSTFTAGPTGGQVLADFGADVIKIERPGRGDPVRGGSHNGVPLYGLEFLPCNRNKRSLAINLKAPPAQDIVLELVKRSDVIISSLRPGAMERLGLGYDDLSRINPGLIYATMTSFGAVGGYSDDAVQDLDMEALSGLATSTQYDGLPVPFSFAPSYTYPGIYLAIGVTLALAARVNTGRGQVVDGSMFATALTTDIINATGALNGLPHNPEAIPAPDAVGLDAALESEFTRTNAMVVEMEHPDVGAMRTLGIPVKLSRTPGGIRRAPPVLGEHNREILAELLGYTPDQIDAFEKEGLFE